MKSAAFVVLLSILFVAYAPDASAQEKITGAFGIKLGQVFDPKNAVRSEGSLENGTKTYYFVPRRMFQSLTEYSVSVTPKTRKVYKISANGDAGRPYACEREQDRLLAVLQKKYGKSRIREDVESRLTSLGQDDRSIYTICYDSGHMFVTYTDWTLRKLAEDAKAIALLRRALREAEAAGGL